MAKVYTENEFPKFYPDEVREKAVPCWFEMVGWEGYEKNGDGTYGKRVHRLMRCTVEDWNDNDILTIVKYPERSPSVYAIKERYGDLFVFWDDKPTEPYFKGGWPEWEELGEG